MILTRWKPKRVRAREHDSRIHRLDSYKTFLEITLWANDGKQLL